MLKTPSQHPIERKLIFKDSQKKKPSNGFKNSGSNTSCFTDKSVAVARGLGVCL
jgi:hypothetical protein